MTTFWPRPFCLALFPLILVLAPPLFGWAQPFTVVNVIPNYQSGETNQNPEPSVAVDPNNTHQAIVSAFSMPNGTDGYYLSTNGGTLWSNFFQITYDDTAVDWGRGGTVYMARLFNNANQIEVQRSLPPNPPVIFAPVPASRIGSNSVPAIDPDQPWIKVAQAAAGDHIYVAYNDVAATNRRTPSMLFSLNGGATWSTRLLDRLTNGNLIDSPAVRVTVNGDTVYGVFQRYTSTIPGTQDPNGDVVVVRDDAAGTHNWGDLGLGSATNAGSGIIVDQGRMPKSLPMGLGGTALGLERLGSDLAIAVHPLQPVRVYVAYAIVHPTNLAVHIHVQRSLDSGATWSLVYQTTPDNTNFISALPALAVAENGSVGLLYTALRNNTLLETHFVRTSDDFAATVTDDVLASFTNGTPTRAGNPYVGDFQSVVALSNTFYGAFSSANDPKTNNFPKGVFFQRNVNIGGTIRSNFFLGQDGTLADTAGNPLPNTASNPNGISIDPYFFCVPALGGTNTLTATNGLPDQAKWLQRPDISPTGLDVLATAGRDCPIVADDFMCTNTGPITDVYIWGSWRDDQFDPNATMTVSFWSDQPATNGQPSHPASLLYTLDFGPNAPNPYTVVEAASCCTERFLDPTQPAALGVDTRVFAYHFAVTPVQAFLQTTGTVYWLSISASGTTNLFGWKTCITNDHNFDDAAFNTSVAATNAWVDLHYPPTHPYYPRTLDMAFALLDQEEDFFATSLAAVTIALPGGGTEDVLLSGPVAINTNVGLHGETSETSSNGLDQVRTEMVSLNLQGTSSLGPINLVLRRPDRSPFLRSMGMITEFTNVAPGRLDLAPFAASGCGESFFDVCFEVHLTNAALGNPVWHNETPKHMDGYICSKPPGFPNGPQNTYYGFTKADLRDEAKRLVAFIIFSIHVPEPQPDVPVPLIPPESKSVIAGTPVFFSVTAGAISSVGALEPLTYQWQKKATNDLAFTNIPGATNSVYSIPTVSATADGTLYQVVIRSPAAIQVISGPVVLNVAPPVELLRIDQISAVHGQVSLSFHADPERTYSVLYKDSLNTNTWPAGLWLSLTNVAAAPTNRVLLIPDTPVGPERFYRLVTPALEQ